MSCKGFPFWHPFVACTQAKVTNQNSVKKHQDFKQDKTTFTNRRKTNKTKIYDMLYDTDFKSALSKLNKQHGV